MPEKKRKRPKAWGKPRKRAGGAAKSKAAVERLRAAARPASLEEWADRLRTAATTAAAAGAARGACLVPDPAGGPSMCVYVDADTCARMKGRFLGGPC